MKRYLAIVGILILTNCAGYRPIVDMKYVDPTKYEQDLAECQAYAKQVSPAGEAVTAGAVAASIGAAFGAILGWLIYDEPELGAEVGAAIYGISGAAAGGAVAADDQMSIIRRCMQGRGYTVLR